MTITLDDADIRKGFITVVKEDTKGTRKGKMPLTALDSVVRGIAGFEAAGRQVAMISRFSNSPVLSFGQNGTKWLAVKEIAPAAYFLTTVTGQAYKVEFPKVIAKVGNFSDPYLFWTAEENLTPQSKMYPLVVGNIDNRGWVCLGTTGLKCKTPDGIDAFVRKVIEAPSTGTYLPYGTKVEEYFEALTKGWDKSIGAKSAITLDRLLDARE